MKKLTKHYKKLTLTYISITVLAFIVNAFFLPFFIKYESTGNNIFTVILNGTTVGQIEDIKEIDECMREARLRIAMESEEMVMLDTKLQVKGREVLVGKVDSHKKITDNMYQVLLQSEKQTLHRSYTVKINEFMVNLADADEVVQMLQAAVNKYDTSGEYKVSLELDPTRELNVLTAKVERPVEEEEVKEMNRLPEAGAEAALTEIFENAAPMVEKDFDDYDLGLIRLEFGDTVEVVEAYLPEEELTSLAEATEVVTKDQEKNTIYEVVSGDTLSQISEKTEIPMDKLIAMNEILEDENSTIRVGDELIITIPEPELSVVRQEEVYVEEDYEAEVVYVPNDDWYTTKQVTLQEPSAGHREAIAVISYRNNTETGREIVKEEVHMEAVPKIVEKGTKIPPTYIKPISGGRQSSGFGRRKAPTKGASTYHKGIDWAVPTGTAVVASSGGTVTRAGWGSGYGYVVYIRHTDGRETRYAHLSKVLVKAGQKVSQGQKIALSGNTGRSTGPHLHFEMIVNGSHVNPLKYLN